MDRSRAPHNGGARAIRRAARLAVATLVALGATACISPSDPLAHADALQESQKRYTEAIRWGDFERAARYVDPEMRDDFLAFAEAFEDVRITDYEIGPLDFDSDEKRRAEVEVTYQGYALPYLVQRETRDHQVWLRDEALGDDRWRVQPALEPLLAGLAGRRR